MDFVVSKVAMSICALLVVSVLGEVLGDNALFRNADELDSVLNDLSTTLEASVWSGCETDIVWRVPFLSDGENIDVSVSDFVLSASSGQISSMLKPACDPHTWVWNGTALNRSSLEVLDIKALAVKTCSGLALTIQTRVISFENQDALFVFVSAAA